jgi:predicted extracellular nuclease
MFKGISETPLKAAFFCATILTACTVDEPGSHIIAGQCPDFTTPISSVQGDATDSPMLGRQVTVKGIVTLLESDHGLYLEQPRSDSDERTSNAVFIQATDLPTEVGIGSAISASGEVSEIGDGPYSLTAITDVDELIHCASDQALPLTEATLPLNGPGREALEGMRIAINDSLTVTDVFQFGRGNITLSGGGLQFVPTELVTPGRKAAMLRSKNKAFTLAARFTRDIDQPGLLVTGTSVENITGVLAHDGRDLRISLQSISLGPVADFAVPQIADPDTLRVVGMNLHNYFNGDGKGRGFPTQRGAETPKEFQQQRDRIGAAIEVLDPHAIAVMELENDGFGPASAAQDMISLANTMTGKTWAVTRPVADNTGDDAISVGVFYRSDRLKAIGPAQTLTGPEFERSRQPIAQLFQPLPIGETILVVVNHLKSKGSCPDSGENADQKDGQGCWNPMRTASAEKMSAWATSLAEAAGTGNILVLGDMNAYRNEDPVNAIRRAGFIELMDQSQERPYSFAYYGQHGTLDYAFSSAALVGKVQRAFIWNVNAALPDNMALPQPWLRFSDHDPVVVDLRLRQSKTSD